MFKKHKYFIILIAVAVFISGYIVYYCYQIKYEVPPSSIPRLSTTTPTSSVLTLTLPSLEEIKAKTADRPVYKNEKYGIKIKYPPSWNYIDESESPYGIRGGPELADYKAPAIFITNRPFAETGEEITDATGGASIGIFYSTDLSKIPAKESIANDYKKRKYKEIKIISLNGFEGVIATAEFAEEERGQLGLKGGERDRLGLAFRKFNDRIYYVQWGLSEEYQYSKDDYSNTTYQNQFLPFLASFEIKK